MADVLAEAIPNTLALTGLPLALILVVGVAVGVVSAVKQNSWIDHAPTLGALFVYSMPGFWLGLMLIIVFSLKLGLLPASQMQAVDAEFLSAPARFADRARHLVLPVFVLGIASAAAVARYTRGSLLDVIRQDYIRTARAKGFARAPRHSPPCADQRAHSGDHAPGPVLPVPALGRRRDRDDLRVAGDGARHGRRHLRGAIIRWSVATNLVAGVMVVAGNLLADVLYAVVDPRIRYE